MVGVNDAKFGKKRSFGKLEVGDTKGEEGRAGGDIGPTGMTATMTTAATTTKGTSSTTTTTTPRSRPCPGAGS